MNSNLTSQYPLPPSYYKHYTDENLANPDATDVLLSPPKILDASDSYQMFGQMYPVLIACLYRADVEDKLPTLADVGVKQLFPESNYDTITELKKLNRSILMSFIELLEVLMNSPEQIEHIRLLFNNIHHLLNNFRPHQNSRISTQFVSKARDTLRIICVSSSQKKLSEARSASWSHAQKGSMMMQESGTEERMNQNCHKAKMKLFGNVVEGLRIEEIENKDMDIDNCDVSLSLIADKQSWSLEMFVVQNVLQMNTLPRKNNVPPFLVFGKFAFKSEEEDEISFNVGDPIVVLELDSEFSDGWWKGRSVFGQCGLLPENHVTYKNINNIDIEILDELMAETRIVLADFFAQMNLKTPPPLNKSFDFPTPNPPNDMKSVSPQISSLQIISPPLSSASIISSSTASSPVDNDIPEIKNYPVNEDLFRGRVLNGTLVGTHKRGKSLGASSPLAKESYPKSGSNEPFYPTINTLHRRDASVSRDNDSKLNLSEQINTWSNYDVLKWLSLCGFEKYSVVFSENRINGNALLNLDSYQLFKIGVSDEDSAELISNIAVLLKKMNRHGSLGRPKLENFLGGQPDLDAPSVPKIDLQSSNISSKMQIRSRTPKMNFVEIQSPKLNVVNIQSPKLNVMNTQSPKLNVINTQSPQLNVINTQSPQLNFVNTQSPQLNFVNTQNPKFNTQSPKLNIVEMQRSISNESTFAGSVKNGKGKQITSTNDEQLETTMAYFDISELYEGEETFDDDLRVPNVVLEPVATPPGTPNFAQMSITSPVRFNSSALSPLMRSPSNISVNTDEYEYLTSESDMGTLSSTRSNSNGFGTLLKSPESGEPLNVGTDNDGWLQVRVDKSRTWKRRWCILKNGVLYVCKDQKSTKYVEMIQLGDGYEIMPDVDKAKKGYFAFIAKNHNRTYHFASDTQLSMIQW
ncbi:Mediator of RNA polymerase II transcription subunit 7, partial [Nowakowskiella sp. JEL0078]